MEMRDITLRSPGAENSTIRRPRRGAERVVGSFYIFLSFCTVKDLLRRSALPPNWTPPNGTCLFSITFYIFSGSVLASANRCPNASVVLDFGTNYGPFLDIFRSRLPFDFCRKSHTKSNILGSSCSKKGSKKVSKKKTPQDGSR